jgi:hypothetical protein
MENSSSSPSAKNNTNNYYCSGGPDPIVQSVIGAFLMRSQKGIQKYGKTLNRDDLSFHDWIQHAQEEHMDAILYLEKVKQMYPQILGGSLERNVGEYHNAVAYEDKLLKCPSPTMSPLFPNFRFTPHLSSAEEFSMFDECDCSFNEMVIPSNK